jgi:diguanylate cyclase (GGDEF)-like protein
MLPLIAAYVGAPAVVAFAVHDRKVGDEPLASWPRPDPLSADQAVSLRVAVMENRTVVRADSICVPAGSTESGPVRLVLFLSRPPGLLNGRLVPPADVARLPVPLGMLLTRRDLIDRLEGQTLTDALTGLPNRRALAQALERELAVAERTGSPLAVAMLDLDHFKRYNDTYGHGGGDDLLQAFSEMLRVRLRTTDFAARFGGEEFCVLLPFTTVADAEVVLGELHRRGRELAVTGTITFSAGISLWDRGEPGAAVLDRADRALYAAKAGGRARTSVAELTGRPRTNR